MSLAEEKGKVKKRKLNENLVFKYAKERYDWEHSRKNELNNMITIPMGLLSVVMGGTSYLFTDLPKFTWILPSVLFYVFLCLTCCGIFTCWLLFIEQQTGYSYSYMPPPEEMHEFAEQYIKYFKDMSLPVDYDKIDEAIDKNLYCNYVKATSENIKNNETKTKYYRGFLLAVMITVLLIAITYAARKFIPSIQ